MSETGWEAAIKEVLCYYEQAQVAHAVAHREANQPFCDDCLAGQRRAAFVREGLVRIAESRHHNAAVTAERDALKAHNALLRAVAEALRAMIPTPPDRVPLRLGLQIARTLHVACDCPCEGHPICDLLKAHEAARAGGAL